MGSVGVDYKCPCCGRVGNGGYAVDGIGLPVCTEGAYSCLWFQLSSRNWGPIYIVANAIDKLFHHHKITLPYAVSRKIADMLTDWETLEEVP
jgi:hypothetical protein